MVRESCQDRETSNHERAPYGELFDTHCAGPMRMQLSADGHRPSERRDRCSTRTVDTRGLRGPSERPVTDPAWRSQQQSSGSPRAAQRERAITKSRAEQGTQCVDDFGPVRVVGDFLAQELSLAGRPERRVCERHASRQWSVGRNKGFDRCSIVGQAELPEQVAQGVYGRFQTAVPLENCFAHQSRAKAPPWQVACAAVTQTRPFTRVAWLAASETAIPPRAEARAENVTLWSCR